MILNQRKKKEQKIATFIKRAKERAKRHNKQEMVQLVTCVQFIRKDARTYLFEYMLFFHIWSLFMFAFICL